MELLKHRKEKDIKNQEFIKEILDKEHVQRYTFGSLDEMKIIRNLMLDKIMEGKLNTREDLEKLDNIKEKLVEYFYVENIEQLDLNDYVRYIVFDKNRNLNDIGNFELKSGVFRGVKDNYIILKNGGMSNNIWKIKINTPLFCKLDENDKMIMAIIDKL